MKKSTIFLLVIIYAASILIVGLFGISIKGYNPVVYVDSISIVEVDNKCRIGKAQSGYDYYFKVPYEDGLQITFEAVVLPENTNYPNVTFYCDESETFTISVDSGKFITISFLQPGFASFYVQSQDGEKLEIRIAINCH